MGIHIVKKLTWELVKIGLLVLKSLRVVPKVNWHARESLCAYQFTALVIYCLTYDV